MRISHLMRLLIKFLLINLDADGIRLFRWYKLDSSFLLTRNIIDVAAAVQLSAEKYMQKATIY